MSATAEMLALATTSFKWLREYASMRSRMSRSRVPVSTRRVNVDDVSIYSRAYGTGDPVVMLHGGFMFSATWAGQIPELARGHRVVTVDSRGHGRSTLGSRPPSYRVMADDVAGVVESLGLGPSHVVGWSDGGCTAMAMAMSRPDLVRSMVLLGTPFNTDNYSAETRAKIESMLKPGSPELLMLRAVRRAFTPEPRRWGEFADGMRNMWLHEPDFTADDLVRISSPTLVIACDRDEFLSSADDPLGVFESTARLIPGARLSVIPGGTHEVCITRPGEVNRVILDFLEGA